jgi:hypothetical protein
MKAIATTLLTLVALPMLALAKGQTTHITLDQSGRTLAVMKGEAAREFQFDYAPFGALPINIAVTPPRIPAKSWIVEDWIHPVPEPAASLPRVQVSFHLLMNDSSTREYVVLYVFDPATGQGYIHLPGKGEKFYEANIFTVIRGPDYDGRWFRASAEWVKKARAAMVAAR